MKIEILLPDAGRSKVIRGRDAELSFERANNLLPGTLDGLLVSAANRGFRARCYECDFERCGVRRLAGFLADGVSPFSSRSKAAYRKTRAPRGAHGHDSPDSENSRGGINTDTDTIADADADAEADAGAGSSDDDSSSTIWHMVALNLALNRIASAAAATTGDRDQDLDAEKLRRAPESASMPHRRQHAGVRAARLLRPLRHLCVLDLSNNLLESMSGLGLDCLPHLQVLSLANNHIDALCFGYRSTSHGTGTSAGRSTDTGTGTGSNAGASATRRGSMRGSEASTSVGEGEGEGGGEDGGEDEGKVGDGNGNENENDRADRMPMPMRCLRRLDVSMNAIVELNGTEMARLPVLETLNIAGNQLTHLGGLTGLARCQINDESNGDSSETAEASAETPLGSLRCLDVQCNQLDDVSGLQSVANLGLLRLHVSANRLHDLDQLSHALCLLARPGLQELFASRNPVCASRDYKLRLLEAPNLQVLDHTAVTPFLRQRSAELRGDRAVEACVASTTGAYMAAIAAEQRHADDLVAYHRSQIKQVQSLFVQYKKQMEAELEDCVGYTQSLANPSMRSSYLLTPQAAEEWRTLLDKDTTARSQRANDAALELVDAQARDIASRSAATAGGYFTKLRALAFHRPGVWQAMKASEMRRREKDQARREEREERETEREAHRAVYTMHVAEERAENAVAALRPRDEDTSGDHDRQQIGQQRRRQVREEEQQRRDQEHMPEGGGKADSGGGGSGQEKNTAVNHAGGNGAQGEAATVRARDAAPKERERSRCSAATTLQAWWRCALGQRLYARLRSAHSTQLEGVDKDDEKKTEQKEMETETASWKAKQEGEHLEDEAKDAEKMEDRDAVHSVENPSVHAANAPRSEPQPQQLQQQNALPPPPKPAVQQTRQKSSACTVQ